MTKRFNSIRELIDLAVEGKVKVSQVVLDYEVTRSGLPVAEVRAKMAERWQVMVESMEKGVKEHFTTPSGLSGGNAYMFAQHRPRLIDGATASAVTRALAVNEVNANMDRIVATPTAGACGILPAVLWSTKEKLGASDEDAVDGLFVAAGIGLVIANRAFISGAAGGCQAECGSAASMAAGAACEMAGGTPEQVAHAMALCLKNNLGLICDPVGGLVEVPCVKRNAIEAAQALVSAEMALAGIKSYIPPDEVIDTMREVGESMPAKYRETACGGLATSPTAQRVAAALKSRER